MTKNNRFSPASEKGHFNGLVVDGKHLRQSLLYRQIMPRPVRRSFSEGGTPSRPKISGFSVPSVAKNLFNLRNLCPRYLRLINDLRSTKDYVRKNNLFLKNKAKFKKSQMNVTGLLKRKYEQMDTWSISKNKAKTKPIQSQFKAKTKPIQTQYKANSNPIKPNFRGKKMCPGAPKYLTISNMGDNFKKSIMFLLFLERTLFGR